MTNLTNKLPKQNIPAWKVALGLAGAVLSSVFGAVGCGRDKLPNGDYRFLSEDNSRGFKPNRGGFYFKQGSDCRLYLDKRVLRVVEEKFCDDCGPHFYNVTLSSEKIFDRGCNNSADFVTRNVHSKEEGDRTDKMKRRNLNSLQKEKYDEFLSLAQSQAYDAITKN